jgi:signal transduction histidine kinase
MPADDKQQIGEHARGLNNSWKRAAVWWDVAFYAVVGLTMVMLFLAPADAFGQNIWVAMTACVVLLLSYALLGRPAARTRDDRLATPYLVILVVATTVAIGDTTFGTFLLFAAFSQIWMLSNRVWRGALFTVILVVTTTVAIASWSGLSAASLLEVAPQMGIIMVFSIGMGVWVATSMRHTRRLAETLDELDTTREALAAAHRAEGVTSERERMAREIHDTLAQGFTSIVMLAQTVRSDVARKHAEAADERLELIERTARENLAEARALVAAFSPVGLTDSGIGNALHRLADRFEAEAGVVVRVEVPDEMPPVDREREVVLLRAAQEALTNVRRHARASAVTLSLSVDEDRAHLEVTDDGQGFESGAVEGYGLRGMRARVASTGGEVTVGSGSSGGTRVVVSLPPVEETPRSDRSEYRTPRGEDGAS